jgi:phage gp45-like
MVRFTLYWLLGTSVQKEALWPVLVSLFLSARGNSGIEIVGESFSTTRENKEVLAADSHERHAQTAGESCKRQLQA